MKQYKAYCFDLDGTVYRGSEGIQSAIRFIQHLQKEQIDCFFVTNNSSKTSQQFQQSLKKIGLHVSEQSIYSSALATAKYVKKHFHNGTVQFIGSEGLRIALENENISLTDDINVDVVVMGIDVDISYEKLSRACLAIQNGAKLIGTNEDVKFPTEKGLVPGNGSFVRLVANVTSVEPLFMGKPSSVLLEMIQDDYGFSKEEMVMIGDNYDTDIMSGIRFGCDTIHVNTGVTSTEIVKLKEKLPTYCIENLEELL